MLAAAAVVAGACASLPLVPHDPAPFDPAARVVDGELAADEDLHNPRSDPYNFQIGDSYAATWAEARTIRVALLAPALGDKARLAFPALGGGGRVLDWTVQVKAGRPLRIWVGAEEVIEGAYQLVLEPAPARLEAPPRNDATSRRERYLRLPVQRRFATDVDKMEQTLRTRLSKFEREGAPIAARLEAFAGIELPVVADRCYLVVLRLGEGAEFSDIAQRGLEAELELPDGAPGAPPRRSRERALTVLGRGAISGERCSDQDGNARFTLATKMPSAPHELGTGPITIEIWKQPNGPLAQDAAARDQAIATVTRGHRLAKTVSTRLEDFHGLELPLRRGHCYVMALKLGRGASFSPEIRKRRNLAFNLEKSEESVSGGPGGVGPGGVATLGCPQRAEKGRFTLGHHDEAIGSGPVTVQIFTRAVPEKELRQQAAEDRAERADSNRRMSERKGESCQQCIEQKISCHRRHGSSCYDDFLTCVRTKGYRESECGG